MRRHRQYSDGEKAAMHACLERVHRQADRVARRFGIGPPNIGELLENLQPSPSAKIGGLLRSLAVSGPPQSPPSAETERVLAFGFAESLQIDSSPGAWIKKYISDEPPSVVSEFDEVEPVEVEMMDVADPATPAAPAKRWMSRKSYRLFKRAFSGMQ